jgi:flagellar protein FliS
MDTKNNPTSNEYLKTKVMTASPEQLQLMLYDGAIRFCEQARPAIESREIEKSYKLLTRAQEILMEMCNAMRDEYAPETCARMRSLYIFCYEKLVEANIEKKLEPLDEALKVIRHMRETWVLLLEKLQQEKAGRNVSESAVPDAIPIPPPSSAGEKDGAFEPPVGSNLSVEG